MMNTQVKYKNIFGEELTIQQIGLPDQEYEAELYVDGSLKKIDGYVNGNLEYGTYYLASEENLDSILTQYKDTWNSIFIYMNKQIIGDYSTEDWESYNGFVKVIQGKSVYDSLGRLICSVQIGSDGSISKTTKIYYLESYGVLDFDHDIPDYGTFDFHYDYSPTSPMSVGINLPGFEHKLYNPLNENNIFSHFMLTPIFNWNDHPYYHNADPLVPTTTV